MCILSFICIEKFIKKVGITTVIFPIHRSYMTVSHEIICLVMMIEVCFAAWLLVLHDAQKIKRVTLDARATVNIAQMFYNSNQFIGIMQRFLHRSH